MLIKVLAIGAGGFLGAISRFLLSTWAAQVSTWAFPVGTLLVNVLGCFLMGFISAVVEARAELDPHLRDFLTVGILGSLTTFSTFGAETIALVEAGGTRPAVANVTMNVAVGLIGVLAGRAVGKLWLG
jgi:CrcB protein